MMTTIEISMYPLDPDYGNFILDFIHRLRSHEGLIVQTNSTSTHIFGEYDHMMSIVQEEMKKSFEIDPTVVMVMKIINRDLS